MRSTVSSSAAGAAPPFAAIQVRAGSLRFVWEDGDGGDPIDLVAGDSVVIPPDVHHRVEPGPDARFVVQFHR